MKEQLLSKILEYLNNGEAFFKEQAPDFVNQYLAYAAWDIQFSLYVFTFLLVVGFIFLWLAYICEEEASISFGLLACLALIAGFVGGVCSFEKSKQLELAPKVFLLKQMKEEFK